MLKQIIGFNRVKYFIRCPFHGLELRLPFAWDSFPVKRIWTCHGLASTFGPFHEKIKPLEWRQKIETWPAMMHKYVVWNAEFSKQNWPSIVLHGLWRMNSAICKWIYWCTIFLSLGYSINCARACSSRPKLFATKRVVFGKLMLNSSLFRPPKPSAIWLDPVGLIFSFRLSRLRLQ